MLKKVEQSLYRKYGIVQNRIKGMIYCLKKSLLHF